MGRRKGLQSYKTAISNAEYLGKVAARDPNKSRLDNPESSYRPDLRQAWDKGYRLESVQMELGK